MTGDRRHRRAAAGDRGHPTRCWIPPFGCSTPEQCTAPGTPWAAPMAHRAQRPRGRGAGGRAQSWPAGAIHSVMPRATPVLAGSGSTWFAPGAYPGQGRVWSPKRRRPHPERPRPDDQVQWPPYRDPTVAARSGRVGCLGFSGATCRRGAASGCASASSCLCAKYGVRIKGVTDEDAALAQELVDKDRVQKKIVALPFVVESDTIDGRIEGKYRTTPCMISSPAIRTGTSWTSIPCHSRKRPLPTPLVLRRRSS